MKCPLCRIIKQCIMAKNCETQHSNQHPSQTHQRLRARAVSLFSWRLLYFPCVHSSCREAQNKVFCMRVCQNKEAEVRNGYYSYRVARTHSSVRVCVCVCDELLLCSVTMTFPRLSARVNVHTQCCPTQKEHQAALKSSFTNLQMFVFLLLLLLLFLFWAEQISESRCFCPLKLEYLDSRCFPPPKLTEWGRGFPTPREPVHHFQCSSR